MFLTPYLLADIVLVVCLLIFLLHKYVASNFNYWEKRQVFYFDPKPIFGNFYELATFKTTIGEFLGKLYSMTNEPFFGIFLFRAPVLIVKSRELLKNILVKDFDKFMNRTVLEPQHDLLTASTLFFNRGQSWKNMRSKSTPVFTSGKIKAMSVLLEDIGLEMNSYIAKQITKNPVLEAKELCAKFTTDVIAKCAFAINAHSFTKEDADFRKCGQFLFELSWRNAVTQTSAFAMHALARLMKFQIFDPRATIFLRDVFWKSIEQREKSNAKGNDFIDLLVELRKNKEFCRENNFEGDKVVAQAFTFFIAGFETTSSTISFALYELSIKPEIQQKLRLEIEDTLKKTDGKITYDSLQEMKYLHMVVSETLRKYPALPFLDREAQTDYQIPETNVVLEKGTKVFIPLFGLHYDPEFFPNPQKFMPERFSDSNTIPQFAYLPFGEGPRHCIGSRLGLLVAKFGIVRILSQYEVQKCDQTPIPVKFATKSLVLASEIGLPIIFKKSPV